MKFFKRTQTYKASNVEFNPKTLTATSYNWWHFVSVVNGYIVFNNYNYSSSTCKHQIKVRRLLETLGIKIDVVVSTRESLAKGENALENAIYNVQSEIKELEEILVNPRRKKALDESRKSAILEKQEKIIKIQRVIAGSKLKAVLV
jgi:vacuolar-type H+-ATPase subunit I/STV1